MTSSYCLFSIKFEFFLFLSFKLINCFYIIPFDTIYIKDESINETNNYLNDIMQNELYMNLSTLLDEIAFIIFKNKLIFFKIRKYSFKNILKLHMIIFLN